MDYNKVNQEHIDFLTALIGEESTRIEGDIEKDYAHDELGTVFQYPEIHLFVVDKEQISIIMKYANKHNIPVTVRVVYF